MEELSVDKGLFERRPPNMPNTYTWCLNLVFDSSVSMLEVFGQTIDLSVLGILLTEDVRNIILHSESKMIDVTQKVAKLKRA